MTDGIQLLAVLRGEVLRAESLSFLPVDLRGHGLREGRARHVDLADRCARKAQFASHIDPVACGDHHAAQVVVQRPIKALSIGISDPCDPFGVFVLPL